MAAFILLGGLIAIPLFAMDPVPLALPAGEEEVQAAKTPHEFVGVKGCKKCHMKQTGDQFRTWKKGPHAKALETLLGDKAKEIAKARGIDDPSKSSDCLKCHVTGHGEKAELTKKIEVEDGVGCESCHGPGKDYADKDVHGASRELGVKMGMIVPDTKTCTTCHNEESPTYTPFNFEERWKKIAHMIPDDKRKKKKATSGD